MFPHGLPRAQRRIRDRARSRTPAEIPPPEGLLGRGGGADCDALPTLPAPFVLGRRRCLRGGPHTPFPSDAARLGRSFAGTPRSRPSCGICRQDGSCSSSSVGRHRDPVIRRPGASWRPVCGHRREPVAAGVSRLAARPTSLATHRDRVTSHTRTSAFQFSGSIVAFTVPQAAARPARRCDRVRMGKPDSDSSLPQDALGSK